MSRTTLLFDGVYCHSVSSTLISYIRFYKHGIVLERPMGPLEDSKFTIREFSFILDKELLSMAGSTRKSFGIGNADMILSGTYTIQKNKSLHINVKDTLGKKSEYIGTPSKDGKELILIPLRILGNDVKGNRQMAYKFRKFSS